MFSRRKRGAVGERGELLVWQDDRPAFFAVLQQRIGRLTLTKKLLADTPITFVAYDLLE